MDNNKKLKHMEMIQNIISRMSSNSFSLKGWTVTLVAGIFALAGKDANKTYFLIAYIPIIIFWFLDAYYLLEERLFRRLYDKVRRLDETAIDFSMDTSPAEFHTGKNTYFNCLISKTILWFYLPLALLSSGIIVVANLF